MFLSNPRNYFVLLLVCATFFQACDPSQTNQKTDISLAGEKSEFPFSTIEPETYQANVVITADGVEQRYFVARKGERWRLDVCGADRCHKTGLNSDRQYTIDHDTKTYRITSDNQPSSAEPAYNGLMSGFFKGKEYREFEPIGGDGGIAKYKVKETKHSPDQVVIFIDEKTGMIIRQEITANDGTPKFIFELQNVKLEVDDSIFELPKGYQKK